MDVKFYEELTIFRHAWGGLDGQEHRPVGRPNNSISIQNQY